MRHVATPQERARSRDATVRIVAALVLAGLSTRAQATVLFHEVGVAVAGPTGVVVAVSYVTSLSLWNDRLHVGIGARATAYFDGAAVDYPNGDPGLLAAGARNTLAVNTPRTYALDAMVSVAARLVGGFELGVNIDVIGVGAGPQVTGAYTGTDRRLTGAQPAAPTRFNLLLLGTHDRGQLDSEFFVAYWPERWGVRAGVSHMSTEYTTQRLLDGGNDRFRAPATRFFVAAGYRFR